MSGFDRRRLLGLGLGIGAAGVLGTGVSVSRLQPKQRVHPPFADGRLSAVPARKRVIVIGGGLAGIATASTLATRGYHVVLCEQSDALGGKLAGWPIDVAGETLPMEHGFHAFFRQYYNLRGLLARAGADRHLVAQAGYTVLHRDLPSETFGRNVLPFPFDLLEVVGRSPGLGLGDVTGDRPGMNELVGFDPVATFARWDDVDLETFIQTSNLDGRFAELILRPFGQASMNGLSSFSAAEAIRFFHFYMLGNPEGLGFDALSEGVHLSVLEPLRAHLIELGVEIRTSTRVESVRFEQGRAVGVKLQGEPARAVVELPERPGSAWEAHGEVFVRSTPAGVQALSSRCTHMGCPVGLRAGGFGCPCHAGRYDNEGRPIAGPPPRPLARLQVEEHGAGVRILGEQAIGAEQLDADAVVIACEVGGLRAIAEASDFATHAPALAAAVAGSRVAEPYSVVRFWFDRPVEAHHPPFYTVSGFRWTDGIAICSALQDSARDWATRHAGSVVETHAYAIPAGDQGELESYRDALLAELRVALPELAEANIVHEEAMTQANFTGFAPGAWATRPEVRTSIPNLLLAGDHVKLPFPAFLMEAATASGILAANAILAGDGVAEAPIHTVPLRGTLAE